ncbi:MAG: VCBS repeat-containing protein [Myxococcales bacterium]|nr:VCBS repeat-containing protein [Myxococcales bacterium]
MQMLDYNGDGFTDLVDAVNKRIYVNKGNTKWEDASENLQSFPVTGTDPNMRFFDYNGDKAIDVISSDGNTTNYWVSDGKGNWKVVPGQTNIGLGFANDRLRLIDINGDGLQDIVHITKNSMRYRKYLGYGEWTDWIDVTVPGLDKYELNINAQFSDINGDGMADMVAFLGNKIVYFVNKNGTEFLAGQELQAFKGVDIPDSTKATVRIADINGNGSRDIVWIDSSGKLTYLELFSKRPNLMTEISNGIGQRINVEYGSSVNFFLRDASCDKTKDAACAGPWQNKMPMAFTVVTKISTWASRSDKPADQAAPTDEERPMIQAIYYHDGFYDGVEKKFRGFRHVETIYDGDDSVQTRKDEIKYDVGDTDPYRHGRLLESLSSDKDGHTYRRTQNEWGDCPVELGGIDGSKLSPPLRYICLKSQDITHIEGETDQSKWRTTRTTMTYDGYGNVSLLTKLGDKDKQGDEQYVKKVFITLKDPNETQAPWVPRAVQQVFRCDAPPDGNDACAETRYYYDGEAFKGLALGEIRKGNLSRLEVRRSKEGDWINVARRQYDTYGNVIAYKGLTESLRTVEWDSVYHRFSVKETAQLEKVKLEASTQWDYALSKVVQSTDYNGHVTTYTYDTFGRISTTGLPSDPTGDPSIRYTYEVKSPISRIVHERKSKAGGTFDRKQIMCFDGLGRQLQMRHQISGDRYLVYTHTEHNRLGQKARLWRVYESDEACSFAAPSDVPVGNMYYDGMGRIVRRVNEDKTESRTVYQPFREVYYDEEDNNSASIYADTPKTKEFDGLGRLIKEIEIPEKGKSITTQFAYTSANAEGKDKITTVTFDNGGQKKHQFDLYGNIVKVIDPDRAETTYTFDSANLLSKRVDGRGIEILYTYDELGRMLSLQEKDQPDTKITYAYDLPQEGFVEATNTKGQISKINYPGGAYLFSYNKNSLASLERHVVLGVSFDFKQEYDNTNKLIKQTMPDGRALSFQRDGSGRLLSVEGLIPTIDYHLYGSLKSWTGAHGVKTTYSTDARDRITKLEVNGKDKVFSLDYTLDAVGNIKEMRYTDPSQELIDKYEYDAIYRLTKADLSSGKETILYQQDNLHNVLSKTSSLQEKSPIHLGDYSYDPQRIHQATKVGNRELKYDDAGYLTTLGAQTMRWDHLGRNVEVQQDGTTVQRAWYNNGPKRTIKEEGGLHTFSIHDDFEIRDGMGVSSVRIGKDRAVMVRSTKIAAQFFDDIGGDKADGEINAGDAWRYHASKTGLEKATLKPRPIDLDLTRDMLQSSVSRMLNEDKESIHYLHADHVGNIRAVTDDQGKVLERKHYYPYGKIRQQEGDATVYAYMGSEWDRATQTYRFKLRSLEPTIGRWLSPDPAFAQISDHNDEWNSYGLVSNNPIRFREIGGANLSDTVSNLLPDDPTAQGVILGVAGLGMALYSAYGVNSTQQFVNTSRGAGVTGYRNTNHLLNAASLASTALLGASMTMSYMYENEGAGNVLGTLSSAFAVVYEGGSLLMLRSQQKELAQSKRSSRSLERASALRAVTTVGYIGMAIAKNTELMESTAGMSVGLGISAALFGLSMYASHLTKTGMKEMSLGGNGSSSGGKISVESFDAGVKLPDAAKRRMSRSKSKTKMKKGN